MMMIEVTIPMAIKEMVKKITAMIMMKKTKRVKEENEEEKDSQRSPWFFSSVRPISMIAKCQKGGCPNTAMGEERVHTTG